MHSRSNKALSKVDLIGTLHDALLIQILSLLPAPDAHRTRVLSSRWKNLWALLPVLHFVMPFCWTVEEINRFHDSADQTLDLRGGMPIQRFYLYCSMNCNYDRVHGWLRKVVQCKVQELELRFPADVSKVKFCWDLFKTCTSLVSLTLRGEFMLNVPEAEMLFPCLKTINLVSIVYCCNKCFKNLIFGCPVLEDLFVERQLLTGQNDNMDTFEVLSPSLKRLRISFTLCVIENFRVLIDAPNLEYLNVLDLMSLNYSLKNSLSLTRAHVNIGRVEPAAQLVTRLSSVKILTLTHSTLMCFVPFTRADPPLEVPACLRFKLKKIIIDNRETISPAQFKLIRYMLKYADNLETLTMNARTIDTKKREQVLKMYRGSISCRIEFV